ncbi:uncharacterized protein LOC143547139 [Bidens hawaiensis]|uniref:uncharacterized protein LOC143547139 n=1 Tax=Bidens hawaiensis TaxID=980011 RepID=UPI00404B2238
METRTSSSRLDAQDSQIKQLQFDVADIHSSLKSLEEDRAESGEFRKVVLAWMAAQEKKAEDYSSASGVSSGGLVFSDSRSRAGPSINIDPASPLPWAVKKVKLPEFSGFDPQGWIQKANLYFDLNHTSDDDRLQLARVSMIGVAQHWFTIITQVRPTISWPDFQVELLQRFSSLEIQNPYEQLATIKQADSIFDFIDDFEYLLSLVPRLPESQSIGYFVVGLKEDVKKWVRLHRPQSRLDAMYLAKDVELLLRPDSDFRPNYSSRFPPDRVSSPKLDSPRSALQPKPPFPMSDSGQLSPRGRGVRSLSRTEWEDRRKKGLCFRCGQQYGPTHKCPEGKLRVLLLGDDEDDMPTSDQCLLQPDPTSTLETEPDCVVGTCNALEFAGTLTALELSATMKLEGNLLGFPICLLVDSGASHNFISRRLVESLGLPSRQFKGIKIKLGDGHFVSVYQMCVDLSVTVGPCSFLVDALVFDTGSLDFILGLEWLKSLGEVVHDWQHSWMRFTYHGAPVQLHGLQAGRSPLPALHQWLSMEGTSVSSSGMGSPTVPPPLTTSQHTTFSSFLQQFGGIFQPPSSLPPIRSHDHGIQLSTSDPISVRPYRYPHAQKTEIERQVQELLKMGMIRLSKSAFSSPVILVRKKDNSWHMCVDYRALNNATISNKYPIPVVDELIDELHGSTFFSKLDLKSGYNQIRMRPDSIDKTAFRTHDGHCEYLVMPFGLINAPATFQAVMNDIFRPLLRRKVVIFFMISSFTVPRGRITWRI